MSVRVSGWEFVLSSLNCWRPTRKLSEELLSTPLDTLPRQLGKLLTAKLSQFCNCCLTVPTMFHVFAFRLVDTFGCLLIAIFFFVLRTSCKRNFINFFQCLCLLISYKQRFGDENKNSLVNANFIFFSWNFKHFPFVKKNLWHIYVVWPEIVLWVTLSRINKNFKCFVD